MAAAVVITPDEPQEGQAITVAATGFGSSDNLTLTIVTPDEQATFVTVDAASGGAKTWTGVVAFATAGIAKVTVADVSDDVVETDVEVFG